VTESEMTDITQATDETGTDLGTAGEGSASDEPKAARDRSAAAAEPATSTERAARKVREGTVVSNAMDKTAVVAVVDRVRHAKYNKFVVRTKKLYAHDETNDVNVGDKVRVMETRPLSKNKRWRITEVLERAK
jgi:small subunit ribosomal protein S17